MILVPFLLYRAHRRRPHLTTVGVLSYVGLLGACALISGMGRLFLRFYAPSHLRTPFITDPGPGVDAVAFITGLIVIVLVAAALLEITDRKTEGARR